MHRERECVERESRETLVVSLVRGKRKAEEEEEVEVVVSLSLEGVGSKGEEETKGGRWWVEEKRGDHRRRRLERSRAWWEDI